MDRTFVYDIKQEDIRSNTKIFTDYESYYTTFFITNIYNDLLNYWLCFGIASDVLSSLD